MSEPVHRPFLQLKASLYLSTITYDTLVRAGVSCTSAFVPAHDPTKETSTFTNPPFAKGSRGINILPDSYFSPQESTPVRTLVTAGKYCIESFLGYV